MQVRIQIASALGEAAGGLLIELNRLTRTKSRVINSPILPGITSGGIKKLIQDTKTKIVLGM